LIFQILMKKGMLGQFYHLNLIRKNLNMLVKDYENQKNNFI
jgi:hypothetical protein